MNEVLTRIHVAHDQLLTALALYEGEDAVLFASEQKALRTALDTCEAVLVAHGAAEATPITGRITDAGEFLAFDGLEFAEWEDDPANRAKMDADVNLQARWGRNPMFALDAKPSQGCECDGCLNSLPFLTAYCEDWNESGLYDAAHDLGIDLDALREES